MFVLILLLFLDTDTLGFCINGSRNCELSNIRRNDKTDDRITQIVDCDVCRSRLGSMALFLENTRQKMNSHVDEPFAYTNPKDFINLQHAVYGGAGVAWSQPWIKRCRSGTVRAPRRHVSDVFSETVRCLMHVFTVTCNLPRLYVPRIAWLFRRGRGQIYQGGREDYLIVCMEVRKGSKMAVGSTRLWRCGAGYSANISKLLRASRRRQHSCMVFLFIRDLSLETRDSSEA